jgi:hypothetical protein
MVVMLPGSDLPSTYNHALWWTLEDIWEVVGSPPYNTATMVPFSLAIWMSRGLATGRPGVGVASTTRDYMLGQELEASFWQGDPSLCLGCLGILDVTSEDPSARYMLRRR